MTAFDKSYPFSSSPILTEDEWRDFAQHWRSDGVLPVPLSGVAVQTSLAVAPNAGMNLYVYPGACMILGTFGRVTSSKTITIPANSSGNPRVDLIVARLDTTANEISAGVKTGTPAVTPAAPTLTRTSGIWEIALAQVAVANGASSITADLITDRRTLIAAELQSTKSLVRNGSGLVAQRGATRAVGAGLAMTMDGWLGFRTGSVAGMTVTQVVATDTVGADTCMRVQRDSGNSSAGALFHQQAFTTVDSRRHAGKEVTVSFRVRKLADFSAASSALDVNLYSGTSTDETLPSNFTGRATVATTTVLLSSEWQTVSFTGTPGVSITHPALPLPHTPSGTAGASDAYELKDVRVDPGPYALPHTPPTYAEELAECQRHFQRRGGVANSDIHGTALVMSATTAVLWVPFAVKMHALPTLTVGNVAGLIVSDGTVTPTSTAIALSGLVNQTTDGALILVTCGGGGLTVGRAAIVYTSGTAANGILDFSDGL